MRIRIPRASNYLLSILFGLTGFQASGFAQTSPAHTQVTLGLSASSVSAGTVAIATAGVSDASGPVAAGVVDLYEGSQVIATLQVVGTKASGYIAGTAILRRIFGSGTHVLKAQYRGTTVDAPATSAPVVLTVGAAATTPGPTLTYSDTHDLTNGTEWNIVSDLKMADVNNDGIPDIIGVLFEPCYVAVSLGDPANPGHFLAAAHYPVPCDETDHVQVVDLDADGLLDLIVTDTDNGTLILFRNNPANPGTFLTPRVMSASSAMAVLDVNRDGLPDIVSLGAYFGVPYLQITLNDPANPGQFQQSSSTTIPGSANPFYVKTADMNGDGLPDLIYSASDYNTGVITINILFADPNSPGKFLPASVTSLPQNYNFLFNVGDLNQDGLPDLIAGNASGFEIRLNNPAQPGALLPPTSYSGPYAVNFAIGDINGDRKPDLVVGYRDNSLRIFLGNGDGTVQTPTTLMTGPTAPAWSNSAIAIADVDGDGLNDVLTASIRQDAVQLFRHQVTGRSLIRTATDLALSGTYLHPQNQTLTVTATETTTSGVLSSTVEFYDLFGGATFISIGTAPIVNGIAVMNLNNLSLGFHDYELAFHGDSVFAPSESIIIGINVVPGGSASATTLTANPNPATAGQTVTLQAVVTGTTSGVGGTPSGTIQFFDGLNLLGTATLSGGGASLAVSTPNPGLHSITAVYSGDTTFGSSTSPAVSLTILGVSSSAVLSSSFNPAPYGANVTLSVLVSSSVGNPSGNVSFFDGSINLGSAVIPPVGPATITLSTLAPGTHTLSATYSGDSAHSPATSNSIAQVVLGAPSALALKAFPVNAVAFQSIQLQATVTSQAAGTGTSFVGAITFFANGTPLGTATSNAVGITSLSTSTLASGTYILTASFAGNTGLAASNSGTVTETVTADATSITLLLAPNPAPQNQAVTYSVVVSPTLSTHLPNGQVSLFDSGMMIASGSLTPQGTLTGQLGTLAPGIHTIKAVYAGTANFSFSTSVPVTLIILSQDFVLTTSAPTVTIHTEHHAPLTVSLQSVGGLADTVALSCSGLPAHATCTFASSQLSLGTSALSTQVMIDTDDVLYYAQNAPPQHELWGRLAFAGVGWLGGLAWMRRSMRRRRLPSLLLWIGLLLPFALAVNGCSGKDPGHTAPGTYSILVSGQAGPSGISHSTPVSLVVTP